MDFKPKSNRIHSVWSILTEKSHFRFLCLLKVQCDFAKNWFGKNIRWQFMSKITYCPDTKYNYCISIIILISNTIQCFLSLFD